MSYPRGQYYWVNFGLDDPAKQQEAPLDALGQWQGKTKAVVEWDFREKRLPNNRVVHYAIPICEVSPNARYIFSVLMNHYFQ